MYFLLCVATETFEKHQFLHNLRQLCHRALCLLFSTFNLPVLLNAHLESFSQVPSLLGSLSSDYACLKGSY